MSNISLTYLSKIYRFLHVNIFIFFNAIHAFILILNNRFEIYFNMQQL